MMLLHLTGGDTLPEVAFNSNYRKMRIAGRCIPENAQEFFAPLLTWTEAFLDSLPTDVVLDIHLEYFNSSSVSSLASLVCKVNALRGRGTSVTLNWHYEEDDEDMMDSGTDIIDTFGVEMNLVPVPAY